MGLGGCCCLVKYFLILINIVFWAAGIAAFTLFGWMLTDTSFLISITQKGYDSYIGLLVFVGIAALTLIIAFLGCCGALKESQCMLVSFFCFLFIVLVAEIATGVYAYLHQDQLLKTIKTDIKFSVQHEYSVIESKTLVFNIFQEKLECCGADGPRDWQTSKYNNNTNALNLGVSKGEEIFTVPTSCCMKNITAEVCKQSVRFKVGETQLKSQMIHQKGCLDKLLEEAQNHLLIILAAIVGIITVEIFALLISLCLCCAVGDRDDVYKS